jgi:hypothetical protein
VYSMFSPPSMIVTFCRVWPNLSSTFRSNICFVFVSLLCIVKVDCLLSSKNKGSHSYQDVRCFAWQYAERFNEFYVYQCLHSDLLYSVLFILHSFYPERCSIQQYSLKRFMLVFPWNFSLFA